LDRLNAQAYRPEILKAIDEIKADNWCALGDVVDGRITQGATPTYGTSEEICLKTKHVQPILPDEEIEGSIDPAFAANHADMKVQAGTVLINRSGAGSIGRTCVYLGSRPVFTNEELFRFRVNSSFDPAYIATFFSTWWGERVLEQGVTGSTGQLKLAQEFMGGVPVRQPSKAAQQYIGSRIYQAEAMRRGARETLSKVSDYHDSLYSPLAKDENWRPFKLSSHELCDLLTAEAYPPDVAEYFRSNSSISLGKACEVIYSGTTRPNSGVAHDGVEQATSRSCTGQFIRRPCNRVVPPRTRDKYLRRGDIVVTNAAHDKSYIGRDYTLYHDDRPNFPSTKVLVLRPSREHAPASYLHHVLKSPLGYRQTQAVIRGISAGIAPDDMERIRIPLPALGSNDRDRWFAMDEDVYRAGFALEVASCLTSSARFLVEALIEGKVSEAELIAAGKDPDADRALLVRLRDDGLDGVGTRLFPDIDALFDLIAQVQGTGAESCVDP
jgi:type I restriction enzyme S subunit